ncbi:MAG: prepilin peptidase [Planctomycetota bacterium]
MNRLRKKLPLIATLAGWLAVIAIYVVVMASIQSKSSDFFTFKQLLKPRLVDVIVVNWFIYVGCSIGSFLNVVAWRMPRGQEISGGSRCARCANKLKVRDNFPVLGWISLLGRCRYCSLPISRRYPIVEALVGLSLMLVGVTQLYWIALPLPEQLLAYIEWEGGPLWAPRGSPTVIYIVSYHFIALSSLWAMALIRIDGGTLPNSLRAFSMITLVLPMLILPVAMIVPWQTTRGVEWVPDGRYAEAPIRLITALVAAAFFARVLARSLCPRADLKLDPLGKDSSRLIDLILMLAIPSVLIGWQSMPAVVVVATLLSLLVRPVVNWIPINDLPKGQIQSRGALEYFSFALPVVLTFHLTCWRPLWRSGYWPSDISSPSVIMAWAVAALLIPSLVPSDPVAPAIPPVMEDDDEEEEGEEDENETTSADELPDQQRDPETDDGNQR